MDFFLESMSEPVLARAGAAASVDATPRPRSRALRSACIFTHRCGVVTGAWRAAATDAIAQSASIIVAVLLGAHAGNA